MKILVTGSRGFVGRNLVSQLHNIRDGKARNYGIAGEELTIYEYDMDSDPAELDVYCKQADFVFNLAGVNRPKDASEFMKGNFGFASTLLDTLKKYGNTCPVMISSSTQAALDNPYGESKRAGEQLLFEVMLPYRSLWSNVAYCHEMLPVRPGDHIVSMLPLGHVFGMVYDFLYGFSAGAHLYFLTRMPSPKIIAQSFSEIRPRVISCVPLIVEKIIKKDILPRIDNKIGKLLLRMPIVNDKIKADMRKKAMEVFGSNFDEIIIGGAPFNAEVERFLKQIGFPYTIAYGMTECGPIICSSRWETLKLASCGKATTRMEVKIDSPDPQNVAGEIICKGANLMLGYYKNAEATSQIIDVNGWLHTGDLATMDTEGYVTVRGRSKNMLLTASGQNIYPEEIESKLNNMPYVSESLIVLQKDKLVALIYPDFDDAFAHGMEQSDIEKVMEDNRNELNLQLPAYCQITKVKIHFEEFEKTAKKSIKRFMYQEVKG